MADVAFSRWGILELLGDQKIAGRITSMQTGFASYMSVAVPATAAAGSFTKMFPVTQIVSITITTEAVARATAGSLSLKPLESENSQVIEVQ
jgi:hypothetical protein